MRMKKILGSNTVNSKLYHDLSDILKLEPRPPAVGIPFGFHSEFFRVWKVLQKYHNNLEGWED